MKLISVDRFIGVYSNNDDSLISEIPITLSVKVLKEIITPVDDDNLLYMPYALLPKQLSQLKNLIGEPLKVDFDSFLYVLECNGNYEW